MSRNVLALLAMVAAAAIAIVLAWPDAGTGRPTSRDPVPTETADARPEPATAELPPAGDAAGNGGSPIAGRREVDLPAPTVDPAGSPNTLAILVHDGADSPAAGVPLRLAVLRNGRWVTAWSGNSGADGTAEVDDVRRRTAALRPDDAPTEALLLADATLGTRPRAVIDLTALPEQPVVLTLPPTGSVVVIVDGSQADGPRAERTFLTEIGLPEAEDAVSRRTQVAIEDGRGSFPWVGLGLRLRAQVQVAGANEERVIEFDGPTAPTQEVVVRVPLLDQAPVLVARLVDPDGTPVADEELGVTAEASLDNSTTTSMLSMQTDTEGRVFFSPNDELGPTAVRSLAFRTEARSLHVQAEVPRPLKPGENDLGTLRMSAPPLLIAGRVVDAVGDPIVDAEVELKVEIVLDESNPDARYWDHVDGGHTQTDAEGQFEVHGVAKGTSLNAHVGADGYLDAASGSVPKGTRGVLVTLGRAGGVSGEILLPELGAPVYLRVKATHRTSEAVTSESSTGGQFELTSIEPGRVDVGVSLFGRIEPVAGVQDVLVEAGRTTLLDPIDLTSALRRLSFRVVDANGALVRSAHALWIPSAGQADARYEIGGISTRDGLGEIVVAIGPVDLLVYADGYRSERVVAVRDGQDIVLPPAPRLRLQVPASALPGPPFELRARVRAVDGAFDREAHYVLRGPNGTSSMAGMLPWDGRLKAAVDASGAARLDLPHAGTWAVSWKLARTGPDGGASATLEDVEPHQVIVRDTAGEQVIRVEISAEQIEQAIAQIQ